MDAVGIQLLVGVIGGAICAGIAGSKGRSVVGWFVIGFLIPLIGIIVALVVSNKKEEENHRAHAQAERRRLREQLRQERIKNETFQRHAASRLDTHDRALKLDTRRTSELGAGGTPPLLAGRGIPPPLADEVALWHFAVGSERIGPVTESELREKFESGELHGDTLVWRNGLATWAAARNVSTFEDVATP